MKRLFFWVRLLLGMGLIGYLAYAADWDELRRSISVSSPLLLLLAYVIGMVDRVWMAYKWNILLQARQIVLSLYEVTVTYLMSTFLGLFLPSTVGGDAIRTFAVSRAGYSMADVASTIVIERVLGILALLLMVVVSIISGGILIGGRYVEDITGLLWGVSIAAIIVGGLLALSLSKSFEHSLRATLPKIPGWATDSKIGRLLSNLYNSYTEYRSQRGLLYTFFFYSFIENLFPIFWSYTLARAFQLQISLLDCFIVVPSVLILRRLPISIDGIGVHQTAFVYLLSFLGVPSTQGLLLGVATHLLATMLVLPGGLFYILKGFELSQMVRSDPSALST
ncbi:MAG: lysylphosphatidylglycerol synthase transmembrane domain-containing protein [Chloroflexota bacterium]